MAESLAALLRLAPRGALALEDGTVNRAEFEVFAAELDLVGEQLTALVLESRPQNADELLVRWEEHLQLRAGTFTTAQRIDRVLARLRLVPDFTPPTMDARAGEFSGVDWTLSEPGAFRCDDADSVCDDANDVIDGNFCFILSATRAAAVLAGLDAARRSKLDAFMATIRPAHTASIHRLDDFRCDDALSLLNRDLLGA